MNDYLIGLLVLLLTSLVIIDGRLVDYLCHKPMAEMEASIPKQFQRPGVYPDHASEGHQSFWLSAAASLSVAVGAGCLIQIAARRKSRAGLAYGTVFVICLGLQLFYCQWFYGTEFYRVSPELAGAGLAVQLGDIPAVAVLLVLFTIALAYCLCAVTREKAVVSRNLADQLDRRALHETAPCLIVMGLGAVAEFGALLVGLFHQAVYPIFPNLSPGMRTWFGLTLLLNPNILLVSTQLFFVFQLCYVRWRRRQEVVEWELPKLSATSLAANWIAVLVAVLTGVPTLSAFGFLFWTSPFNVFGM